MLSNWFDAASGRAVMKQSWDEIDGVDIGWTCYRVHGTSFDYLTDHLGTDVYRLLVVVYGIVNTSMWLYGSTYGGNRCIADDCGAVRRFLRKL